MMRSSEKSMRYDRNDRQNDWRNEPQAHRRAPLRIKVWSLAIEKTRFHFGFGVRDAVPQCWSSGSGACRNPLMLVRSAVGGEDLFSDFYRLATIRPMGVIISPPMISWINPS